MEKIINRFVINEGGKNVKVFNVLLKHVLHQKKPR